MKKHFLLLFILCCSCFFGQAQLHNQDSLPVLTTSTNYWNIQNWIPTNASEQKIGKPLPKLSNDWNFFTAIILLIIFCAIKIIFPKYIKDTLRLIGQSNIHAKQIKDQVKANVLASILLDVFFAIVLGSFVYLFLQYKQIAFVSNNWTQMALCILIVGCIYLVKFLSLRFFSWVFQMQQQGDNYIFTVFFYNKVSMILLLPVVCFLLINKQYWHIIIPATVFILAVILIYRFVLCYISIAKSLQISSFHFFVYLYTVEIAPLLILYKALLVNYK